MNVATTNVTEKGIKVQFPALLGFSCWKKQVTLCSSKGGWQALHCILADDVMALWTCMKCITSKYGSQMHHLLNLWKKAVPIRSRDVLNATCLFHTRPQESCVVILRVGPVWPWNRCGFSLAFFISRLSVKNTNVLGTVGVSLRSLTYM